MFEYTFENHFQFGYTNGRRFCNRQKPEELFYAEYGRSRNLIRSWRESNIEACKAIYNRSNSPLWVLFSGGVDSEICIRSFLEAKIPINVATLEFENKINDHDIHYVKKLESTLGIKVHYFRMNLEDFVNSSGMYKIVDKIECVSPILACHLWLANQIDGVPIIAQGEPHLKKVIPEDYIPGESPYMPSPWRLVESERLCSLYKHFIFENREAVPGFFQYLPEQIYSYLKFNPLLNDLVNNQIVGKLGTRTSKNKIAYQFYPEIETREKYTGFEKIQELHDYKRQELANRFPHSDDYFYMEYNELVSSLDPEKHNKAKEE